MSSISKEHRNSEHRAIFPAFTGNVSVVKNLSDVTFSSTAAAH
jgi:hypothetical protein